MPFNVALSGIRAASMDLEVTGNNISNASTIGFKESRAEFGDVYASTLFGSGSFSVGSGVQVADVAQQFGQGNIAYTENALDLAISGAGFFIQEVDGDRSYTRDGTFSLDSDGYVVSNGGGKIQGYDADSEGNVIGVLTDLQISTENIEPLQTDTLAWRLNLDAEQEVPVTTPFDPTDATSYNSATSVTIYDSLGVGHTMTQYFVMQGANADRTEWNSFTYIDGEPAAVDGAGDPLSNLLSFDSTGQLAAVDGVDGASEIQFTGWAPTDALDPTRTTLTIDYVGTTMYADEFGVIDVDQDGYATGTMSGLEIDETGIVFARFTNGQSQVIGQVALADFTNTAGLQPVGNNAWAETFSSGEPNVGTPGSSVLGLVNSGALEESNTDLTEQLVQLIIAQRNYQANSKTIETADTITQTIINI